MLNRTQRERPSQPDQENPYWVSFSDIMAGLLVIFILSLVALMIRLHNQTVSSRTLQEDIEKALEDIAQIEEIRRSILEEVKADLEEANIEVEIADDHRILRVPERQLSFDSGEHAIPPRHARLVRRLGESLFRAITKSNRSRTINTIFIEGHTDSVPYERNSMGNWGLSAYRAISIWNYWTDKPGALAQLADLTNDDGEPMFSVSGYADTRRVELHEESEEERRRNRRIDIRFSMRATEGGDLEKLLERMRNEVR